MSRYNLLSVIFLLLLVLFLLTIFRFIGAIIALIIRIIPFIIRFWYIVLFIGLIFYVITKLKKSTRKTKPLKNNGSTIEIHDYKVH